MKCPKCSATSTLLHKLGMLRWFKCDKCGHTFHN